MRFEIEINFDAFVLLSDVGDAAMFEFEMKDSTIESDKMIPTPDYLNHFEKKIFYKNLSSTHMTSLKSIISHIQQMLMTSPFTQCSIENIPPSYLVFGLVDNDAFDGSVSKNP